MVMAKEYFPFKPAQILLDVLLPESILGNVIYILLTIDHLASRSTPSIDPIRSNPIVQLSSDGDHFSDVQPHS
jgi:hypothetical protein